MKKASKILSIALSLSVLFGTVPFTSNIARAATPVVPNLIQGTGSSSAVIVQDNTGKAWGWGTNARDPLGTGMNEVVYYPQPLPQLANMKQISINSQSGIGIRDNSTVWTWGSNNDGQLATGTTTSQLIPVEIPALAGAKQVTMGSNHGLALMADGTVMSWGSNSAGQLGINSTTNNRTPIKVQGLDGVNVVKIAAGGSVSFVVDDKGDVWSWGSANSRANGDTVNRLLPKKVEGVSNITSLATGFAHVVALDKDGNVWTWGSNTSGEIGNNSPSTAGVPTPFLAVSSGNVSKVFASYNASFAVTTTGALIGWGYNTGGMMSNGTTTHVKTPTLISSIAGVKFVATVSNATHIVVVKNDNTIWSWGQGGTMVATGLTTGQQPEGLPHLNANLTPTQIKPGNVEIEVDDSTGTPESKTVILKSVTPTAPVAFTLEYKMGSGPWTEYTGQTSIKENGTLYARVVDTLGFVGEVSSVEIAGIVPPVVPTPDPTPGPTPSGDTLVLIPGLNKTMPSVHIHVGKKVILEKNDLHVSGYPYVNTAW